MPVIKSAIKKLRHDRAKTTQNDMVRANLRDVMRKVRKNDISLSEAYSVVDKNVKLHLLHPNKGARLKSKIAAVVPNPAKMKAAPKVAKSTSKAKAV